ncbi:DNA recombination protein RmuC, partial [bacterium]|nr:DNA recombination protein RmuC [bacterium]
SSEVWQVLAAVKTEFGNFGGVLDKLQRQLSTASKTVEETGVRTRAIERKLRGVEELPDSRSEAVLELGGTAVDDAEVMGDEAARDDD